MRIVQVANFVGPRSGGIKTVLDALGRGYRKVGHEVFLIVPGRRTAVDEGPAGRRIVLRSPLMPGGGGYRVIVDLRLLCQLLEDLRPDRLEVSDRSTLGGLGSWSRSRTIPAVAVVHERLDALLALRLPSLVRVRGIADYMNRGLAARFDAIVCPSLWAAEEFHRVDAPYVRVVPWGVDLETFAPQQRSGVLRRRLAAGAQVLLTAVGRLWAEKRPQLAVRALRCLRAQGVNVRLVVVGAGPLGRRLRAEGRDLPVTFLGHMTGRGHMAELLATADVALALGPVETFGLTALEALACGTPVVTARTGATPELLAPGAGLAAWPHPNSVATAIRQLLACDEGARRAAARARAEQFSWDESVAAMLRIHSRALRA